MRILLLDDDPIIIETLSEFLKKFGHEVIEAADTFKARDNIDEYHGNIDVLLSGICLPVENGITLIETIKKNYPNIDVVWMTGQTNIIRVADAIIKGACAYIRKPIMLAELNILMNQISKNRQDRELVKKLTRELKKERKRHGE